ncbi:thioredoxin family protein [Niabella terrae]
MKFFAVLLFFFWAGVAGAQDSSAIAFNFSQQRVNDKEIQLTISALVSQPDVRLFALQRSPEDAVYSSILFDTATQSLLTGELKEDARVETVQDPVLELPVNQITDSVRWQQTVLLAEGDSAVIKGTINYMFARGEEFPALEKEFRFVILPEAPATQAATGSATNSSKESSLWWIFAIAFAGGLLALATPCIYSMIPITVSFFTKRSTNRAQGLRNALIYSLSIITIFTFLGFLITLIFGPDALNKLSTHWIANLVFFTIFLVFGLSFLGAFEIELPASWGTAADSKAGTKNMMGIFFLALTLVIVSFSCTSPIIGGLLVLASKGSRLGPLVGMFGFSLALALPFALFAFFPSKLNVLGKSGGWLNAVKVTLGFLELALALKFLSNADLTQNWRILDREIFLVLWIAIFLLLSLYLLGKIRFRHDSALPKNDFELPHLSVTRLLFAGAALAFTIYLVPGLWGAPLRGLSAFLPPMGTQDFNADDLPKGYSLSAAPFSAGNSNTAAALPAPVKYAEVMKKNEPDVVVNNGLITYFDYQEALAVARQTDRPLMLDFTGINCINCRKMEGEVWSDPEVIRRLRDNFVIASLFVDVHKGVDLPISEQYESRDLGKTVETLGELNTDLQVSRFGSNTQPFYFFLDNQEQRLAPEGYPYDPSVSNFIRHLDQVVATYKERKGKDAGATNE